MLTWNQVELGVGGVEGHVALLSDALRRAGHDVRIVGLQAFASEGRGAKRLRTALRRLVPGDTVRELMFRHLDARALRRSAVDIEAALGDVDVVHMHDFIRARLLARSLGSRRPVIWTNHLGEFLRLSGLPLGQLATRRLTSVFDLAVGPSHELANGAAISPPVRYIANGVDTSRFYPREESESQRLRRELGLPDDQIVVLVPRRWAPTKGVLEAARAVALLRDLPVFFVFAGSIGARDYPTYGGQIHGALEMADRVQVLSSIPYGEMPTWVAASDVVLVPSVLEATSLAALEAMASARVVVATRVGGLEQLIEDGRTGILIARSDAALIEQGIRRLLALDAATRRDIGRNAASVAATEYSWDRIANSTVLAYRDALAQHRGRR